MVNQFSPVQQQLAQLENLENNQLKQLLVELEAKKRLLPVDDHAIIDWGINTLKARILDEERLMTERDGELEDFCRVTYGEFIEKSYTTDLGEHTLSSLLSSGNENWRNILHKICFAYLNSVVRTALVRYQSDTLLQAVSVFKGHLSAYLQNVYGQNSPQAASAYKEHIDTLKKDLNQPAANPRQAEIYGFISSSL